VVTRGPTGDGGRKNEGEIITGEVTVTGCVQRGELLVPCLSVKNPVRGRGVVAKEKKGNRKKNKKKQGSDQWTKGDRNKGLEQPQKEKQM